jgi:hypothetical protein
MGSLHRVRTVVDVMANHSDITKLGQFRSDTMLATIIRHAWIYVILRQLLPFAAFLVILLVPPPLVA